jgi:hypothetical protein
LAPLVLTAGILLAVRVAEHREQDSKGLQGDDRPPICPACGVTMVPAALSADEKHEGEWVCLECEELDEER